MNSIKRSIHIAAVTAIATIGIAAPSMAAGPSGPAMGTIGSGPVKPTVAMSHAEWKHCWSTVYANWRGDGFSPQSSTTAADWTCGSAPTK